MSNDPPSCDLYRTLTPKQIKRNIKTLKMMYIYKVPIQQTVYIRMSINRDL